MSGVGKAPGGFAGRLVRVAGGNKSPDSAPTVDVPSESKKNVGSGSDAAGQSAAVQAKTAAKAVLEGKTPHEVKPMTGPEMTAAVTDIIRDSPTGSRILDEFEASGLSIEFSDAGDAAGFYDAPNGKLVISDEYLTDDPHDVVGVVMHELGHFIVDRDDDLESSLNDFPDGTGHLADEVIAEAIAVQVTSELGIARAGTAMSDDDGNPRSFSEGMQYMLDNEFYVEYYGIDLGDVTSEDRSQIMEEIGSLGLETISRYADSPLEKYEEGVPESGQELPEASDDLSPVDVLDGILDSGALGIGGSIVGGFL